MDESNPKNCIFLAFGTKGDVLPVAEVAVALAQKSPSFVVTFVTHAEHEILRKQLTDARISYDPISSPPVLSHNPSGNDWESRNMNGETTSCSKTWKALWDQKHREEVAQVVHKILGAAPTPSQTFIAINFFALEGWHLAELYSVPCVVVAPYVVPYSAPTSFERIFRKFHPLLCKRLQNASPGEIGWDDVMHWMWPLFTDRWTEWRVKHLGLAACPLTDPVTELPIAYHWPRAPLVLYGVSPEVVECPAYWPSSVHLCGFWCPQTRWDSLKNNTSSSSELTNLQDTSTKERIPLEMGLRGHSSHSSALIEYLSATKFSDRPAFVGLGSIGSMGFLEDPEGMLKVLHHALQTTNTRAILFTAAYKPLEAAIFSVKEDHCEGAIEGSDLRNSEEAQMKLLKEGFSICDDHIFCYSGFIPYSLIFPKCGLVLHHGGSGTTAAALLAGIPQIICPFIHDQFYWAERMAWIGVSPEPLNPLTLMPRNFGNMEKSVEVLVSAIKEASTREMQSQAAKLAQKLLTEDGIGNAVSLLLEEFC